MMDTGKVAKTNIRESKSVQGSLNKSIEVCMYNVQMPKMDVEVVSKSTENVKSDD